MNIFWFLPEQGDNSYLRAIKDACSVDYPYRRIAQAVDNLGFGGQSPLEKSVTIHRTNGITRSGQRKKNKAIAVMPVKRLLFALLLTVQPYAHASNTDSPYFKGGKIDAFYDLKDNGDFQVNSILWTPVFKGGYGVQVSETGGQDINYFGGFARPLLTRPDLGDLILGAQEVLQGDSKQTEVQGEYRLPSGLGFGGGFVDRNLSDQDIKFAKISYRNEWQSVKYIVSTQWQSFQGKDYPGGYVALFNKQLMGTWGSDGEQ